MFQIVEVKLQSAQHLLHGVGVSILLNHANIFCSFSRFISKNQQKRSKPLAFSQKMLIFAQESNTLFIMTTISSEHSNNAVIKSIQAKAESIMPKDAKVILFGSRARKDAKVDSDWDILVLLNKEHVVEQDHDDFAYPLWELGWQLNQIIHPIVVDSNLKVYHP